MKIRMKIVILNDCCEDIVMEWYSESYFSGIDGSAKNETELANQIMNGLTVEGESASSLSLVSYFVRENRGFQLEIPKEISGGYRDFSQNKQTICDFIEDTAIGCLYGPSMHGALLEGVKEVNVTVAMDKMKEAEKQMEAVRKHYDGWQDCVISPMEDKEATRQWESLMEYKTDCCIFVDFDKRRESFLTKDERKEIFAIYAKDKVLWQEAENDLNQVSMNEYLAKKASNGWSGEKCYSFQSFMHEGSSALYYQIAKQCKKHGMQHVYDIGCNVGFQSRIFRTMGMKYTGVEMSKRSYEDACRENGAEYIHATYPVKIDVLDRRHTAAISNLCIGFELDGKDERMKYDQIAKDFDYFCGSPGEIGFSYFKDKFGIEEYVRKEDIPILFASKERVLCKDKDELTNKVEAVLEANRPEKLMAKLLLSDVKKSLKPPIRKENKQENNSQIEL